MLVFFFDINWYKWISCLNAPFWMRRCWGAESRTGQQKTGNAGRSVDLEVTADCINYRRIDGCLLWRCSFVFPFPTFINSHLSICWWPIWSRAPCRRAANFPRRAAPPSRHPQFKINALNQLHSKRSADWNFIFISFHHRPAPPANHPPPKTAVNVAHDQATPPQPAPRCRQQNQLTKNHKRINSLATLQKIENWNLPEKNISNSIRNINSSAKIPPDGELEWNKIMIIISDKETFQKKRKR